MLNTLLKSGHNPYLAVNLADFQQDFPQKTHDWPPKHVRTKVQNVGNDCGATMSQLVCRVDISRSFQKTQLTPTGLKNQVSFWGVEKKMGPTQSEIGPWSLDFHTTISRKWHLPMSFEASAIAATGFFCHTQDALTKSLANGFWVVCVCDYTILRGFL